MKIKPLTENTLISRVLKWQATAVFHHRAWFVYPQLLLFAVCVIYTARYITVDTSRANLVGSNTIYHQTLQEFKKEFPEHDELVVVIESDQGHKNRQFVENLGARLEAETNLFCNVFYKAGLKTLGPKALLLTSDADLLELKKTLVEDSALIRRFTHVTNLVSLFDMVNAGFRTAKPARNAENESLMEAFPALEKIVNEAHSVLKSRGVSLAPGMNSLFTRSRPKAAGTAAANAGNEAAHQGYLTFGQGRIYLVTAQALSPELNVRAEERLQNLIEQTKLDVPGLNVGLTGEKVLEHAEMQQSRKDTQSASIVAFLICALIFIYGYQEMARPIKATLCLIIGVGYSLALATLTVGHLNILTIIFVPILIGLATDYAVHLISRYEEELRRGRSGEEAMVKAMVYTGQGIITGALTTAGAFLAMIFTNFKGIQEMGIICGGGLLVCLIPMMTLLPVLLLPDRRNASDQEETENVFGHRARIENIWLKRPVVVTSLTIGLCALAAMQIPKVYFDYNLMHMQSDGLQAVEFEKKLLDSANRSLLFGAVMAGNQEEAASMLTRLTNLSAVASVESITKYLSGNQSCKLQLVRDIKAELAPISFEPPDPGPVDLLELSRTFYSLCGYLGAAHSELQRMEPDLAEEFVSLRTAVNRLQRDMLQGTDAEVDSNARKLGAFQRAFFNEIGETIRTLKNQDDSSPLLLEDLPSSLRDRFVGVTGKYVLMVYPKKDLRYRENQKEFIEQVHTVYPNLSGTPVQLYYYTDLLKRSYEQAARYALLAIALLVLFHFRSLFCVVLVLIPVGVGFLWLGGMMGYFGAPLNPANIMILPLVIGIGVTNGIHILNRYAEEQTPGILARSTGKAVLISGFTSIAGFGSLILARHQGIQSLGYVMSFGLAACMIAALAFLPALLHLLTHPVRRANLVKLDKLPVALCENAKATAP